MKQRKNYCGSTFQIKKENFDWAGDSRPLGTFKHFRKLSTNPKLVAKTSLVELDTCGPVSTFYSTVQCGTVP